MNMQVYDVIVIGAGSGGLSFAKTAAKYNKKVLIIDKGAVGGTCVNLGCVPKKVTYDMCSTLIENSEFLNSHQKLDFERFVSMRDQFIEKLNKVYSDQLKNLKIEFIRGFGILKDKNTVLVDKSEYKAKNIILATGSKPKFPEIKGKEFLKTSDDFFELREIPKKTIIVGSGYIAVETAFLLEKLGSEIEIIVRSDKFLSGYDDMIGDYVIYLLKQSGIKIHFKSNIKEVTKNSNSYNVQLQCGDNYESLKADFVLCAIGRDCNFEFIAPEINHKNGYLIVDGNFETSIKNVFAIGDLIGPKHMLTPVAIFCGRKLADYLYSKQKNDEKENKNSVTTLAEKFSIFENIPTVVFSHPPCASVGLSEKDARKVEGTVKIYESEFIGLFYSLLDADKKIKSKVKVVVLNECVVGIHFCGRGADEIIQGFAVALKKGITYDELMNTIPVHPTSAEEVLFAKLRD
ncbi:Glutathione amide reductase [Dictyocoela muelleri]|nr:Glutathione amide reductase [Dictyocoela muelleri]